MQSGDHGQSSEKTEGPTGQRKWFLHERERKGRKKRIHRLRDILVIVRHHCSARDLQSSPHPLLSCSPLSVTPEPTMTTLCYVILMTLRILNCLWSFFHFCKLHEDRDLPLFSSVLLIPALRTGGSQTLLINILDFVGHMDFAIIT